MLHRIGDIDLVTRNTRFNQGFVEKTACWPDEWMALAIFDIPGLLADKHYGCTSRPLAENGLSCVFV